MNAVNIYRDNLFLYGIKPQDDSTHVKRIMGENVLRINFLEPQYIEFKIGDKAQVFNEWFYLNRLPVVSKLKVPGEDFRYEMILESTNHILSKVQFLFLGDDNSLKEGEFSYTGTAQDFLNLIVNNTKRLLPFFNYSIQQTIDDGFRTLTFSSENCLEALAKVSEAFNTEYWVDGTEILLTKKQRDTGYVFKHGKRKGLYEIIRTTVDNQNVVTRLYAFGSDKNLPEGYRNYSQRLKLPVQTKAAISNLTWSIVDNGNGTQTYTFNFDPPEGLPIPLTNIVISSRPVGSTSGFMAPVNGPSDEARTYTTAIGDYEFVFTTKVAFTTFATTFPVPAIPSTSQPALSFAGDVIFLEKNVDKYGLSEATEFFEEVYPHRTGIVTGVNAGNPFEFTDADMNFDVNDYLLPGMTAKVTFNTGQLSGYTFEISSYDNALKKFIILKNKDERVLEVPSIDLRPEIGDKYVIVDITLPQEYIDAAEAELLAKAQAHLDIVSEPQLAYVLVFDPVFLKEKGYTLKLGDLIWIIDTSLQVERKIRIVSIQRNIVQEYQYTIEVSDVISKPKIQNLTTTQENIKISVNSIQKQFQNKALLNNRVIGNFYINDLPEYADNAAALSAGLTPGQVYRTGGAIKVVHA